jgi:hypothetical protein
MEEFVCKVDFHRTSPGLKHGFCGLWNQLIDAAHDDKNDHASSLCVTMISTLQIKGTSTCLAICLYFVMPALVYKKIL